MRAAGPVTPQARASRSRASQSRPSQSRPSQARPSRAKAAARPSVAAGQRSLLFISLLVMVSTLVVLGLVMVLSASAVVSIKHSGNAWSEFNRQARSAAAGLVLMFVAIRIDYHHWRTLAVPAVVGSLMALALLAVPGLGINQNNATRWLDIGVISFQPSEVAKLALLFFAADFLSRPRRDVRNARSTLVPVLACTALFAVLIMLQPHFGNTLILGVIALTMLFWAGTPIRLLSATAFVGVSLAGLVVWSTAWRRQRLLSVFDPWSDPGGDSFQLLQSLHAITVGGIRGTGIGDGLAKWGFVPFAHSDFIFAVVGEEFGLFAGLTIVAVFAFVVLRGFYRMLQERNVFILLATGGLLVQFGAQAIVNMGVNTRLLPAKGMTLPFISYGGSSLFALALTMGMVLALTRRRSGRGAAV